MKPLLTPQGRHHLSQLGDLESWERTALETRIMISDHPFSCQVPPLCSSLLGQLSGFTFSMLGKLVDSIIFPL